MTTERCPRYDRAECPWWATPDPQSNDDLFAIGHEARDCELHAVPIERWRQRALAAEAALDAAEAEREALRASFASQAQVTVTARQAVCDVVVQRDAAVQRAEAAEAREAGLRAVVEQAFGDLTGAILAGSLDATGAMRTTYTGPFAAVCRVPGFWRDADRMAAALRAALKESTP